MPDARNALRFAGRVAKAMIGQNDYDAYVAHHDTLHPDRPAMTREEYFLLLQDRRFGVGRGGAFKCC